jgi:4-hydroxybutyrate CoA-transferase
MRNFSRQHLLQKVFQVKPNFFSEENIVIKKDWETIYENRSTSAEKAIYSIKSHQKVFLAPFCNEPQTLVGELVRQKDRLQDVYLYTAIIGSPCKYAELECHSHFKIRTFLSTPSFKSAFKNQVCDYIPVNLSEISRFITEDSIDAALIQVSPPNEEGYCNLGISVDIIPTLLKRAKTLIAQVNHQLPITNGVTFVHVSQIDHFVLSDRPLLTITNGVPNEEEVAIADYTAELVPDTATVQVGVGKLANSILLALKNKKGLGIHSGSIIDPVIELMDLGVITNEYKEINRFKTVCTTLTGTDDLYRYANNNPKIELYPADYTHNPAIISQISNFHAINSAVEVDIFGQINAEQVGEYPMGGVGGQMDFIKGARLSKGGKAIIALPSTAKKGTQSRITISTSNVTSIKSEIDYVVTEYGIASLFGKSLSERAKALINIAHPNYRKQLQEEYEKRFIVKI